MSVLALPSLAPHVEASGSVAEVAELRASLEAARRRLDALEALRSRQAETAAFFSAVEDHVRAAVFWTCEAELRAALST